MLGELALVNRNCCATACNLGQEVLLLLDYTGDWQTDVNEYTVLPGTDAMNCIASCSRSMPFNAIVLLVTVQARCINMTSSCNHFAWIQYTCGHTFVSRLVASKRLQSLPELCNSTCAMSKLLLAGG